MKSYWCVRRSVFLFAILAAGALSACAPAVVVRPLYDGATKAPADERILGDWITPEVDSSGVQDKPFMYWTIGPYDETRGYTVMMGNPVDDQEANSGGASKEPVQSEYHVRLLPIGDKMFFVAEFERERLGTRDISPSDLSPGLFPGQLVGRITIHKDFLRVALLDSEWVRNHLPESAWVKVYAGDDTIATITAPAEEVRATLAREADNAEAFSLVMHFCRLGTLCAARAAEDEVARFPNGLEVLKESANLFLRQGNYARALALRRHLVELEPKDPSAHEDLGSALLFNRDFAAALREFQAADQLSQPVKGYGPVSYESAFACFLEGDYTQAAKFSEQYLKIDYPDPMVLLLHHVALVRLGRTAEAKATMEKEFGAFKGSWENHFLLLEFQARVTDVPVPSQSVSVARDFDARRSFVRGLRFALAGDKPTAATAFQTVLDKGDRSNFLYLTAKIEQERLNLPAP